MPFQTVEPIRSLTELSVNVLSDMSDNQAFAQVFVESMRSMTLPLRVASVKKATASAQLLDYVMFVLLILIRLDYLRDVSVIPATTGTQLHQNAKSLFANRTLHCPKLESVSVTLDIISMVLNAKNQVLVLQEQLGIKQSCFVFVQSLDNT